MAGVYATYGTLPLRRSPTSEIGRRPPFPPFSPVPFFPYIALAGVALGLAAAWLAATLLESLLFEIPTADVLTFTVAPLALTLAVFAAAFLPARRAAAVDPATALRAE